VGLVLHIIRHPQACHYLTNALCTIWHYLLHHACRCSVVPCDTVRCRAVLYWLACYCVRWCGAVVIAGWSNDTAVL
jgi:hypothetical protein